MQGTRIGGDRVRRTSRFSAPLLSNALLRWELAQTYVAVVIGGRLGSETGPEFTKTECFCLRNARSTFTFMGNNVRGCGLIFMRCVRPFVNLNSVTNVSRGLCNLEHNVIT